MVLAILVNPKAASNAAGRASAIATAKDEGASYAAGRASASTAAKETDASNAAGRASASKFWCDAIEKQGEMATV